MSDLDAVVNAIRRCRICVEQPRGLPLPHEPRPVLRATTKARLVICGQAPGTRVHQSGTPFTDPSGVRLRSWLNMTPETFYDEGRVAIVPMGFCFPGLDAKGGDLPPRRECAAHWHRDLFAALPQAELILAVGAYAQAFHLGSARGKTLQETMLNWRLHLKAARKPRLFPLPHPSWRNNAWLKKNPWFEVELLPVLQREVRKVL
ncbi:MAG: uracil-DNA glycosylase family protein [Pseudomonadota bacterium]